MDASKSPKTSSKVLHLNRSVEDDSYKELELSREELAMVVQKNCNPLLRIFERGK